MSDITYQEISSTFILATTYQLMLEVHQRLLKEPRVTSLILSIMPDGEHSKNPGYLDITINENEEPYSFDFSSSYYSVKEKAKAIMQVINEREGWA